MLVHRKWRSFCVGVSLSTPITQRLWNITSFRVVRRQRRLVDVGSLVREARLASIPRNYREGYLGCVTKYAHYPTSVEYDVVSHGSSVTELTSVFW